MGDDGGNVSLDSMTGIEAVYAGASGTYLDAWQSTTDIKLVGSAYDDVLVGGAGDDILVAGSGGGIFLGNAGNDVLVLSGNRSDFWFDLDASGYSLNATDLRSGIDVLTIQGIEKFQFTDGVLTSAQIEAHLDDELNGTDGIDYLNGGAGNDVLNGFGGNDYLFSGIGDDVLTGGAGDDFVDGEDGFDIVVFSGNRADYFLENYLYGFNLTDLRGLEGTDFVSAEVFRFADGDVLLENILSTEPDRTYSGTADNDFVRGGFGDDLVYGLDGDDWLSDPFGVDVLDGGNGNDHIFAGGGVSQVIGGAGDDTLFGDGDDVAVYSGGQSDYLVEAWGMGVKVTDLRGLDGTDTLTGIGLVRFTDGDVAVADLIA